jgi:hypothetical protein
VLRCCSFTGEAFARNIDCIDLRILCDDDRDFANPIESVGSRCAKIARAIFSFANPGYPCVIAR